MDTAEQSTDSESKMETLPTSMSRSHSRRSPCCYITGVVIICLAILGLLAAATGIIYVQFFADSAGAAPKPIYKNSQLHQSKELPKSSEFQKKEGELLSIEPQLSVRGFEPVQKKHNPAPWNGILPEIEMAVLEVRDAIKPLFFNTQKMPNRMDSVSSDKANVNEMILGRNIPNSEDIGEISGRLLKEIDSFDLNRDSRLKENKIDVGKLATMPKVIGNIGGFLNKQANMFLGQFSNVDSKTKSGESTLENLPKVINNFGGILNKQANRFLDQFSKAESRKNENNERLDNIPNIVDNIGGLLNQQANTFVNQISSSASRPNGEFETHAQILPNLGNIGGILNQQGSRFLEQGNSANFPKVVNNIGGLLNQQANRFWSQFSNLESQLNGNVDSKSLNFPKVVDNIGNILNQMPNSMVGSFSKSESQPNKNVEGQTEILPKVINVGNDVDKQVNVFPNPGDLQSQSEDKMEDNSPINFQGKDTGISNEPSKVVGEITNSQSQSNENIKIEEKPSNLINLVENFAKNLNKEANTHLNQLKLDSQLKDKVEQPINILQTPIDISSMFNKQADVFLNQLSKDLQAINVQKTPKEIVLPQNNPSIKLSQIENIEPGVSSNVEMIAFSSEKSVSELTTEAIVDFERKVIEEQVPESLFKPIFEPIDEFWMNKGSSSSNQEVKVNVEEMSTISDAVVVTDDPTAGERMVEEIDLRSETHLNSPVIESKVLSGPFDFLRKLEQERKDIESQLPSNIRNVELKAVVADALGFLRSLDGTGNQVSARHASTKKKQDGSTKSNMKQKLPETLNAERQEYLHKLRQKIFITET